MSEDKILCYISEQVSTVEDNSHNGKFKYTKTYKTNPEICYCTFEATLQSFDVLNRNQRMYEANNVMRAITTDPAIQEYLALGYPGQWFGALCHPLPEKKGEEFTVNKLADISVKDCHRIWNPHLENNRLKATIITNPGSEDGKNVAINIMEFGYVPAFSLRSFGEMTRNARGGPYVNVKKLITYDLVQFPSHKEAYAGTITESGQNDDYIIYLSELLEYAKDQASQKVLCESFDIDVNSIKDITPDGKYTIAFENDNRYFIPTGKASRDVSHYMRGMLDK